jgi:DNA-directed RNA polymerase subunit RPC12/RpoP
MQTYRFTIDTNNCPGCNALLTNPDSLEFDDGEELDAGCVDCKNVVYEGRDKILSVNDDPLIECIHCSHKLPFQAHPTTEDNERVRIR